MELRTELIDEVNARLVALGRPPIIVMQQSNSPILKVYWCENVITETTYSQEFISYLYGMKQALEIIEV